MAIPKAATEQVICVSSTAQTYSAAFSSNAPTANATDIFSLRNPLLSTRVMKILRVELGGAANVAALIDIALVQRSTFTIGGIPILRTATASDSQNVTQFGVLLFHFGLPSSLGNIVGIPRSGKLFLNTATAATSSPYLVWDFGSRPGQALALYPGECLCISNNGNPVGAGTSLTGSIEWTEE
jgi:hypothetical protein